MGGVDTVRGIAYQQAQAVLAALDVLSDPDIEALRVEGVDDIVDIELLNAGGTLRHAKQVKTRAQQYSWGEGELIDIMRRWAQLPNAPQASFEFLTDGRLGPTGEKVRLALVQAGEGSLDALADLIGEEPSSDICKILSKARLRVDHVPVGALLRRAEHEVIAMLPQTRTASDAQEQAERAVGALFQRLFEHGGAPNAEARLVTRQEIADILGVPADQAAWQRWPGSVRLRYLEAAKVLTPDAVVAAKVDALDAVRPTVYHLEAERGAESLDASALLRSDGPVTLAGRTGTGKSTAVRTLRRDGAAVGRVVLLAHAETYLPGRLEALVADALSELLAEDLPSATGRQALADRDVTLIIDGVSEVPSSMRNSLHEDLLASLAARRGARIVLVGRDLAALREVLPSSVVPSSFVMAVFGSKRRFELACLVLLGGSAVEESDSEDVRHVKTVVAQVEHALDDAAGNALIFTMGLILISEGTPFTSRATLYDAFIVHLATRAGATGIVTAAAALGVVYARLLDAGRRYADPYEWAKLLEEAASALPIVTSPGSSAIDASARRSGLIAPIGYTQTLVPIHDSFADYLAGKAHAQGLAPFPLTLQPHDEQRILFAAEVGGVKAELAMLVARDQPFLTVRVSQFDRRPLDKESPQEIAELLRHLLPEDDALGVLLWSTGDGRVVASRSAESISAWVPGDEAGRELLGMGQTVVVREEGPLAITVRLWRLHLLAKLRTPLELSPPYPGRGELTGTTIEVHARQTATAIRGLIQAVSPVGRSSALEAALGAIGERTRVIDGPQTTAAKRVQEVITDLTKPGWL